MFKGLKKWVSDLYESDKIFFVIAIVVICIIALFFVLAYISSFYELSFFPELPDSLALWKTEASKDKVTFTPAVSKNLSQCDMLKKNKDFFYNCRMIVAVATGNTSICEQIPIFMRTIYFIDSNASDFNSTSIEVSYADYCFMRISESGKTDFCDKISNLDLRRNCKNGVLSKND